MTDDPDRAFWMAIRRALLAICAAIVRRWLPEIQDKSENFTRE